MDEVQAELAELRALIREAHEAIKDIRAEVRRAREEITAHADAACADVAGFVRGAGDKCNELLTEWVEQVSAKCPITMLCPGCGVTLAVLAEDREVISCGACGRKFRVRSAGEQQ